MQRSCWFHRRPEREKPELSESIGLSRDVAKSINARSLSGSIRRRDKEVTGHGAGSNCSRASARDPACNAAAAWYESTNVNRRPRAAGRYKAKPSRIFKFEEIREAHRVMEADEARRKMAFVLQSSTPIYRVVARRSQRIVCTVVSQPFLARRRTVMVGGGD